MCKCWRNALIEKINGKIVFFPNSVFRHLTFSGITSEKSSSTSVYTCMMRYNWMSLWKIFMFPSCSEIFLSESCSETVLSYFSTSTSFLNVHQNSIFQIYFSFLATFCCGLGCTKTAYFDINPEFLALRKSFPGFDNCQSHTSLNQTSTSTFLEFACPPVLSIQLKDVCVIEHIITSKPPLIYDL